MRFTSFREMLAFYAGQSPYAPALFYENENRPASLTYGQLLSLTDQEASIAGTMWSRSRRTGKS